MKSWNVWDTFWSSPVPLSTAAYTYEDPRISFFRNSNTVLDFKIKNTEMELQKKNQMLWFMLLDILITLILGYYQIKPFIWKEEIIVFVINHDSTVLYYEKHSQILILWSWKGCFSLKCNTVLLRSLLHIPSAPPPLKSCTLQGRVSCA